MKELNEMSTRFLQVLDTLGITGYKLNKDGVINSQATLTKIKQGIQMPSRDTIDKLCSTYSSVSKVWLLTGEGPMLKNESATQSAPDSTVIDARLQDNQVPIATQSAPDYKEVPLLPVSAQGGSLSEWSESVQPWQCEQIASPFRDADYAIRIKGHSMEPTYPEGCIVLIKKVNEAIYLDWGQPYVLDTDNGQVCKLLTPSPLEGHVRCVSINTDPIFQPFDVPTAYIHGYYRVLGAILI